MDAIHDGGEIDEVHRNLAERGGHGGGRWARRHGGVQIRMPPARPHGHDLGTAVTLSGTERRQHLATGRVIERSHIDGAVALVAQHFNQSGQSLFGRRLELAIHHAEKVHLQRLD